MKHWTRFPFVRLLFPLIAGILVYALIPGFSSDYFMPLLIIEGFVLIVLLLSKRFKVYNVRWAFGVTLNLFLFLLGLLLSVAGNEKDYQKHFSNFKSSGKVIYTAFLIEAPAIRENSVKFTLQVRQISINGRRFTARGKVLAYAVKDSLVTKLAYGSEIVFSVMPEPVKKPANPGEFDYARYLSVKNVFHQVYLGKGSYIVTNESRGSLMKSFALKTRGRLLEVMQRYGMSGREFAVAAALLIGYDDLLDATQRQEYSGAGVVHILCVSGLHVGVVFLIADSIFFFLRKRKKMAWLRPLLIILVIWLYATITGLAPSVLRASLMFSLITIGKSLNRHSHTYNTLAASAFILLIINPGMLYDLGFQLSYAAVAGIVTFQPHIRKIYTPGNKVLGYVWDLTSVSIAAQLITAPISVYYFHQFPNYFLLANLIAIPLAGVLIYTGVAFIFLSFIPLLGKISAIILIAQIKLLNAVVAFIERLPGAVSHDLYLSTLSTIALFLLLFSILMWYLQKNKVWLYPVLTLCFLLAVDHTAIAVRRMNNQLIIVQSINRHSAIGFINGQTQHLITDSAIVANPAQLKYSTDSYRISSGIRKISYIDIEEVNPEKSDFLDYKNGFFSFKGKRGVVLSPAIKLPAPGKQIRLDYVILTNNVKYKLEKLNSYFPGALFIADASNSVRKSKTWGQEAIALKLQYYSVRESGAWIAEF